MIQRRKIVSRRMKSIQRLVVQEGETAFTGNDSRPSEKCTGCMSCMAACALAHEGCISTAFSGIRIHHHSSAWVLHNSEVLYSSSVCAQCPGVPPCDEGCPKHAHFRDEDTGAVMIDPDLCIRCRKCVDACPFNACWYSPELDRIVKCDLCAGLSEGPQCINVCPSKILKIDILE
jgi:Fe-S-cluster-containing dehydrogenase component